MKPFDFAHKRAVVVGLGASGIAACKLLRARGAHVVGSDQKSLDALGDAGRALLADGITLALGGHAEAELARADLVVVSPGVPVFPALTQAEGRGVPIWGEVELAVRALATPSRVVAVGGTNGKSTTTSLIGDLLARHLGRVFVGGNLGEPLSGHTGERFDAIVLEVSSFQMERVDAFAPEVSVLLNVTADHLDRYDGMADYARAKGNAFVRQTATDVAVVPANDPICLEQARRGGAKLVTFGPDGDVRVTRDAIECGPERYLRADIALSGGHNALNVAAALAAIQPFGLPPGLIREVLASFRGLPHRMALVRQCRSVRYYDDSKGTNVGATVTAVQGITEPKVILIAGGRDKGGSYEPLVSALRERGRGCVLIGEAQDKIAEAIRVYGGDSILVQHATSMGDAVRRASLMAQPGDAVLLSPACSSFDMFRDYKDRGDAFVKAVEELPE